MRLCKSGWERARQCAHTPVTVGWEGERLTHVSKRTKQPGLSGRNQRTGDGVVDTQEIYRCSLWHHKVLESRPVRVSAHTFWEALWPVELGGRAETHRWWGENIHEAGWLLSSWRSHLPTSHCGKRLWHIVSLAKQQLQSAWFSNGSCFFFLTFSFSSSWKLNSWLKTAALIVPRRFCRFLHVSPLILWSVRLSYGALKLSENMAFIKARLSCQRIQTSAAFVRRRRKWKFVIERNQ